MASQRRAVPRTVPRTLLLPIVCRKFLRIAPRILLGTLPRTVLPVGLRIPFLRVTLRAFLGIVLRILLRTVPDTLGSVLFLKGPLETTVLQIFLRIVPLLSRTGRRVRRQRGGR